MENSSLIVQLIQQDLKHNQLLMALRSMGLEDGGLYDLDLMGIVANLMLVPDLELEKFTSIYGDYLDRAHQFPVCFDGSELMCIAEECYNCLLKLLNTF